LCTTIFARIRVPFGAALAAPIFVEEHLPMNIGPHSLRNNVFVAPMAGVTDRPFRQLCKTLGAGYAVSEMAASNPRLWASVKTARRTDHAGEMEPRAVQIAGADPAMMAEAARFNVGRGAQIIDINMGCPAKKVCNVMAGSALMADEPLALSIIEAVANAVAVPVTVKMRTGPTRAQSNVVRLARLAESAGAAMIAVHGRSRACGYAGHAEYDTIAEVKRAVRVPVVANGDIDSPRKARAVLDHTGADAVMIGRAAQGRPWIFREIVHFLATGEDLPGPTPDEIARLLRAHLVDHYAFYGEFAGVRSARKHVGWYLHGMRGWSERRDRFNRIETPDEQLAAIDDLFATEHPPEASADACPVAANERHFVRRKVA